MTYDVNENLRVGAMGTSGGPDGRTSNSLAGLDAVWQTSKFHGDKNLGFALWGARSFGGVGPGQRDGWGVKVQYPNDLWNLQGSFKEFGDALDPALGFLLRPGTRQYTSYLAYQPRPSGGIFAGVRQFFFEVEPVVITDLAGETETWRVFMAPVNFRSQAGDHYEANFAPEFERLSQPFEVAPGVIVPAGSYRFNRFRVNIESSDSRPLSVGETVCLKGFMTDNSTQIQAFVVDRGLRTSPTRALRGERLRYLPEGNFILRLWQVKTVYAFNPNLLLAAFFQYDSESENLGMNARLRWTIQPGRDLFVVWNRGWKHPITGGSPDFLSPEADQFIVKLRWAFRR